MGPDFWISRWNENKIGFHQQHVNEYLQQYAGELGLRGDDTVFVPLCGKSLDMLWLAGQGYRVLGVEVSRLAVEAFFEENRLEVTTETDGAFTRYRSGAIEILCGDFFDLRKSHLADVRAVYDRAALIALPEPMRRRYAGIMASLPHPTNILLVSIEYSPEEMSGPPFSVTEEEIRALFDTCTITILEEQDVLDENERFRERGLTWLVEKVYGMKRPAI